MSEETIPQMREALDNAEKMIKDLQGTNDGLSVSNRKLQARDVAREQGYDASRGDLFAAQHPEGEITAEALDAFVQQYNLGTTQAVTSEGGEESGSSEEGNQTEGSGAGSTALSDMARGGSRPGESAGGASKDMLTRQQWQELHANDPIAAQEAVRQGRVEVSSGNPFGDSRAVAKGTNPYATSQK